MKFLRIIFVVCLLLPATVFATSSQTPSSLSIWEISQELSEIWELLNHRDFESAAIRQERLLQYVTDEQVIQDLSYVDFITIVQNYGWQKDGDNKKRELIKNRIAIYPKEKKKCSIIVMLNGYNSSCLIPWSKDSFDDAISYLIILINQGKQKSVERYIMLLQKRVKSSGEKSILGNVITMYVNQHPNREKYFAPMIRDLGQHIITVDPYWVNGYFLASQGLEPWSREALKLCDNLLLNYRGDDNRKRDSVDPFIKRMCLK